MAAKVNSLGEVGRRWDLYETCHQRQFVHRPTSAAEIPLRPASSSFVGTCAKSGPFGSSVYAEDFCGKAACKAECIRGGKASGHRRNNPHPSQSFMNWRLPRGASQYSEYARSPWNRPPSEGEMHQAMTALYRSTYTCDFTGSDPVHDADRHRRPPHGRRYMSPSAETEMRDNYRQPELKPELMVHRSLYSCSTDPRLTCCGIVPTVVQRHVRPRQRGSDLTTYNRFYGNRHTDASSVMKSLPHQELLRRASPAQEKKTLRTTWSKNAFPNHVEKEHKLEPVMSKNCSLERMSSWPGPH